MTHVSEILEDRRKTLRIYRFLNIFTRATLC